MEGKRIHLSPPNLDHVEIEQLTKVVEGGWVAPVGPELETFEKQLCERLDFPHFVALNSGTAALHMALKLAGIRPGDRVGVSTFTFCASANVAIYEQAVPVFFESEKITWNLDPQLLDDFLKKSTLKALIVTHLYGMPAQIREIRSICEQHGVTLIEDAAEALGAEIEGHQVGNFAKYAALSFNGNKILTTGGGGGLRVESQEEYRRCLYLSSQAKGAHKYYSHEEVGYNYRMSNVLAGIGLGQLSKFDAFLEKKRSVYQIYRDTLSVFPGFEFLEEPAGHKSNRWLTCIVISEEVVELAPTDVIEALDKHNIEARPLWKPLHLQPVYSEATLVGSDNTAENLYTRGFCLPSGTSLSQEDQQRIIEIILDLLRSRGLL